MGSGAASALLAAIERAEGRVNEAKQDVARARRQLTVSKERCAMAELRVVALKSAYERLTAGGDSGDAFTEAVIAAVDASLYVGIDEDQ